jgi:hypothetical protein
LNGLNVDVGDVEERYDICGGDAFPGRIREPALLLLTLAGKVDIDRISYREFYAA